MQRNIGLVLFVAAVLAIPTACALAIGFQLGESKEELKLKYDVSIYDHDTGRVTITFTLIDTGRLKPINSVDLSIPSEERHTSGGFKSDLTMSIGLNREGERQVGRIHIRKDWAERAAIQIKTNHLDGKKALRTWYYHSIPLKDLVARSKPHETIN